MWKSVTYVENSIRLCRASAKDLKDLQKECTGSVSEIENVLKQVAGGTRLSPRSLDKHTPAQLKSLVFTLYEQLQKSKEHFEEIPEFLGTVPDYIRDLTPELLTPLLHHAKCYTTIDQRLIKIDKFIDNIEPKLQLFEKCESTCNELKSHISKLSDYKPALEPSTMPLPELNQYHQSQMKELEDLKSAIASLPPPSPPPPPPIIDWTNIKFPPLPKLPTTPAPQQITSAIRNEVRLSQEDQLRRRNVILRGLPLDDQSENPLSAARSFLDKCNIGNYKLLKEDLLSAFFLNKNDGRCTIRMVFSNHWTAMSILESAHKLKSGSELYRRVYLTKDRSDEEMRHHRVLVSDLRQKKKDYPNTYWVIKNGTVVDNGHYSKPT